MGWFGWSKNCDRCGGDLFPRWDALTGAYVACIQCGAEAVREQGVALLATLPKDHRLMIPGRNARMRSSRAA